MKKFLSVLVLGLAATGAQAEVTIPHVFAESDPASAEKVNANFAALATAFNTATSVAGASKLHFSPVLVDGNNTPLGTLLGVSINESYSSYTIVTDTAFIVSVGTDGSVGQEAEILFETNDCSGNAYTGATMPGTMVHAYGSSQLFYVDPGASASSITLYARINQGACEVLTVGNPVYDDAGTLMYVENIPTPVTKSVMAVSQNDASVTGLGDVIVSPLMVKRPVF